MSRVWVAFVVVALTLWLGGCQAVFGPSEPPRTQTVTPAPVPETETPASVNTTETPKPSSNGRALGGVWPGQWSEFDPELSAAAYRDAEPTCERPPALVVRLQVGAILTDNGSNRGIETTWRFLTPDSRRSYGSVESYVETLRTRYRPLLQAESVTHRPLQRNGSVAIHPLRAHSNGSTTTYQWRVKQEPTASGKRCWLTAEILEASAGDA